MHQAFLCDDSVHTVSGRPVSEGRTESVHCYFAVCEPADGVIRVVNADWSVRPVRRRKERSLLARVGGKQHFNGLIAQRDTVREWLAVFSASGRDVPDALFKIDFIPKRERKFLAARGGQDAEECGQTRRRLSDLTCKQSACDVDCLIKRSGRAMPGGVDALR